MVLHRSILESIPYSGMEDLLSHANTLITTPPLSSTSGDVPSPHQLGGEVLLPYQPAAGRVVWVPLIDSTDSTDPTDPAQSINQSIPPIGGPSRHQPPEKNGRTT